MTVTQLPHLVAPRQQHVSSGGAAVAVVGLHGREKRRQRHPVRRVLEASHIHNQHHILIDVVTANRREVSSASLIQGASVVRDDHHLSTFLGHTRHRNATHILTKPIHTDLRCKAKSSVRPIAFCETREFGQGDTMLFDFFQWFATV